MCTILHRLHVWYDRNIINIPSLVCHCTRGEILRWLTVTASGGRTAIIPVLKYGDLYSYTVSIFSVLSVEIQGHTARSNLGHPVREGMPLLAIVAA